MATEGEVKYLEVAAGVILDAQGRVLLGDRPAGKPYAGWWELPGGKLEPGETPLQALARELDEELGIRVTEATPWVTHVHAYTHATVRLAFCRVTAWEGEPQGREGQRLAWVDPCQPVDAMQAGLNGGQLLPATLPPLDWLQVPRRYAIGGIGSPAGLPAYLARVDRALDEGRTLFQLREPDWPEGPDAASLLAALQAVLARVHARGGRVLVNSRHPAAWWALADGVHLRSTDLATASLEGLSADAWIGASTHDARELNLARERGARFAVLGPVLPTTSHPGAPVLGWSSFAALVAGAGLPVFALGGQTPDELDVAALHAAHGVAGIRGMLPA